MGYLPDLAEGRCTRWGQGCTEPVTGRLAVAVPNANHPALPEATSHLREMRPAPFCAGHGLEMLATSLADGCKVRVIA